MNQAREWCERMAPHGTRQLIERDGSRYLERFYLAGWEPGIRARVPGLYLHHFLASDSAEEVHSHPWDWSLALILSGGYREIRCTNGERSERTLKPGDINVIGPTDTHRIELLDADCWTLFLAGEFDSPWGFTPAC